MARPKLDEETLLNGWELEPSDQKGVLFRYPLYLSAADGFGPLCRLGFRTREAALAFAISNPAPRSVKEAGRYLKGL